MLVENIGPLSVSDLPKGVPHSFLPRLEEVRQWCEHKGYRFAMSPFEWQIAKITGDGFCIVLWNSKVKGTKARHIKPAFEGEREPYAYQVLEQVTELTRNEPELL